MKNPETTRKLRRSNGKLTVCNERIEEFIEGILDAIEETGNWEHRSDFEDVQQLAEMILSDGFTYGMSGVGSDCSTAIQMPPAETKSSSGHQHRPMSRAISRRRRS